MQNFNGFLMVALLGVCLILVIQPDGSTGQQSQRNRAKGKGQSQNKGQTVQQEVTNPYGPIDTSAKQNGSLPFNARWGIRPRVSNKIHYSIPASDYWSKHKRPFVPLIEPEVTEDVFKY